MRLQRGAVSVSDRDLCAHGSPWHGGCALTSSVAGRAVTNPASSFGENLGDCPTSRPNPSLESANRLNQLPKQLFNSLLIWHAHCKTLALAIGAWRRAERGSTSSCPLSTTR